MTRLLLLFDLDGTLLDSANMILEAQRQAFASLGLSAPGRERGLSVVGLSLPEVFTELVGPQGPIERLCEAYKQAFFALRAAGGELELLFPGAGETIQAYHADPGCCLGIATGKSQRGAKAIIETYGWQGLFETVQTSDDAPSKPHPGMIENACRATGIAPEQTVMIGDSSYDMRMAKAAGVRAIGVSWGFQSPDILRETGADCLVDDFAALRAEIHRLCLGLHSAT